MELPGSQLACKEELPTFKLKKPVKGEAWLNRNETPAAKRPDKINCVATLHGEG